tara:strand:- start:4140 stop:4385 length:246 start_codon:yes stop_codon:yes gene_type:complete
MSDPYVIVEGNFMDGFKIIGPFHDIEAAQMWGEYCVENEWWFTTLHTPEYDRNEISQGGYYWSDEAKAFIREMLNDEETRS